MEQLYSSVVIAKDTSSMILPGALECASAGEPPAPAPASGRGAGFGGQVVQEVVEQHPFSGSTLFGRQ